jgi:hypothetical protein
MSLEIVYVCTVLAFADSCVSHVISGLSLDGRVSLVSFCVTLTRRKMILKDTGFDRL